MHFTFAMNDGLSSNSCIGCTPEKGRKPGCHATCENYLAFRKKMDILNEKRHKETFKNSVKSKG